ncbi:helix-turn-helix transcriptional regulator [Photobacterium sagamiensis]|uniref:helix-turn-helix transcriptional regulator n=1 Tax=Photobacterium sagamiensis TaxID=2910241 RepID=UPI003D0E8C02
MKNLNYDELVKSLYSSLVDPQGFKPFLSELIQKCNLLSGAIIMVNNNTDEVKVIWMDGLDISDVSLFFENFEKQDPLIQELTNSPPGTLITADDAKAEAVKITHPDFFQGLSGALNIRYVIGAVLATDEEWVSQMFFHRSKEQGAFTPDEKALLEKLIPHMQHATQLFHIKIAQDKQRLLTQLLFNQIQLPVILLDDVGNVCHCNQKADNFLTKSSPLKIVNRRIQWTAASKNGKVQQAIQRCLDESSVQTLHLISDSYPALALTLTPLVQDTNGADKGLAIFIYNSDQQPTLDLQILRDLFDLSQNEGKVCCELVCGRSPAEIADLHFLSYETVRTYIKRVMKKTDTTRQNELVAKLMASPAFYPASSTVDHQTTR